MPDLPAMQFFHDSSVDNPIGVINPIPVTTTFLMLGRWLAIVKLNSWKR
jgi:hypothetical protein